MSKRRPGHGALDRKVTFRLDAKRLEELEDYARLEGASVSFVVRHLVCRFLENQRRTAVLPPFGGLP